MSQGFKSMCDSYCVDYDIFFRTTDPRHRLNVVSMWDALVEKNLIYKGIYHKKNEDDDSYQEGIETFYFRLSNFQEKLEKFYNENKDFIYPEFYSNKVKSLLNNKLNDVSISRNDSNWGIPIKDSNDIVYVWFDALIGYLTSSNIDCNEQFQLNVNVHIIGKDILRFHAILWIALLMSLDLPLPRKLLVHGWLLNDMEKISKSIGNYTSLDIDIDGVFCDITRYNLINSVKFGYDCEYLPKLFETTNSNVRYTFGETLHRVLSLWKLTNDNVIDSKSIELDIGLIDSINTNIEYLREIVDKGEFHMYCQVLTYTAGLINTYINDRPWISSNSISDILYNALLSMYKLAIMSYPVVPNISQMIMESIGEARIDGSTRFDSIKSQFKFNKTRAVKLF